MKENLGGGVGGSQGRDKVKQILYGSPVFYYTLIRRYHPRYAKWPIVPRGTLTTLTM